MNIDCISNYIILDYRIHDIRTISVLAAFRGRAHGRAHTHTSLAHSFCVLQVERGLPIVGACECVRACDTRTCDTHTNNRSNEAFARSEHPLSAILPPDVLDLCRLYPDPYSRALRSKLAAQAPGAVGSVAQLLVESGGDSVISLALRSRVVAGKSCQKPVP